LSRPEPTLIDQSMVLLPLCS